VDDGPIAASAPLLASLAAGIEGGAGVGFVQHLAYLDLCLVVGFTVQFSV